MGGGRQTSGRRVEKMAFQKKEIKVPQRIGKKGEGSCFSKGSSSGRGGEGIKVDQTIKEGGKERGVKETQRKKRILPDHGGGTGNMTPTEGRAGKLRIRWKAGTAKPKTLRKGGPYTMISTERS